MTDSEILLEQYKLYVEMADRISARRGQTNNFYISILSGILALLSITLDNQLLVPYQTPVIFSISLLGISLNILWNINIRSYRQLNSGKFEVIHEMEKQLPFACFDREWELLGRGKVGKKYLQLTVIEKYVPFFLCIPYLFLLTYSIVIFLK